MSNINNPADAEQTVDLQNHVLQLDSPQWSHYGNTYESRQMGQQIADLLSKLKAGCVARTNPQIATFESKRLELTPGDGRLTIQQLFDADLQGAIIQAAAELDIDVAVIRGEIADKNAYYGFRSEKFKVEPPKSRSIAVLRRLGTLVGLPTNKELVVFKKPDFVLRTSYRLGDEYGPDSSRGTWSYKNVIHSIDLVEPDKEVRYYS